MKYLTSALFLIYLFSVKSVHAENNDVVMLHCENENISIQKDGYYLLVHGFGTDLKYQRYNNIDHPVLAGFDAAKQNREKTWVFTETEVLDKNYEIIYVFAVNNLSLKRILYERGDIEEFKKGSRKDPKVCFPIKNQF
ncbi:MAG: hypothetical protein P8Y20_00600 [Gammaproteobacteria bacterium]